MLTAQVFRQAYIYTPEAPLMPSPKGLSNLPIQLAKSSQILYISPLSAVPLPKQKAICLTEMPLRNTIFYTYEKPKLLFSILFFILYTYVRVRNISRLAGIFHQAYASHFWYSILTVFLRLVNQGDYRKKKTQTGIFIREKQAVDQETQKNTIEQRRPL